MAWGRVCRLRVGTPGDSGSAVLVSDLDIGFNVKRSIDFSANTAEFVVWNASQSTREKFLQPGTSVVFEAGYEDDGVSTVFIGHVFKAESVKDGADWKSTLHCATLRAAAVSSIAPGSLDGLTPAQKAAQKAADEQAAVARSLSRTVVSLSYAPGSKLSSVLSDLGDILGLVVTGLENTAGIVLPQGYVYPGMVRGALQMCKSVLRSNGLGLFTDNQELVIFALNGDSKFSTAYLTYENGLLEVKDITDPYLDLENRDNTGKPKAEPKKRIGFKALLMPKIKPNGLVTIKTPQVDGVFLVESIQFSGDNMGGDFNCSGEASA